MKRSAFERQQRAGLKCIESSTAISAEPPPPAAPPPMPPPARAVRLRPPGSDWLYAKLYLGTAQQEAFLGFLGHHVLAECAGTVPEEDLLQQTRAERAQRLGTLMHTAS